LYFYTVKTTVLTTKEIIKDKPGEGISIFYLTDFLLLFIYSHMRTLFGSFLHLALLPKLSPPSPVPGRSHSAFITNFVEEKT
jgi:hypothetical protein